MPSTSSVDGHQIAGPSPQGTSQTMAKWANKSTSRRLAKSINSTSFLTFSFRPLPSFALFLLLSVLIWPGTHGADVKSSNRDSEINSVRHELAVYDNEIINDPEITCGPGVVHFNVLTKKGNASSVYVRGQSQNPDCTFHNQRNVTIELGKCNVRRKREINPNPGIAYQMTLVVQLHPLFVTKVDRAYNVNCFYREKPQDVSVDFGVNEIATHQLYSEPELPQCTYSVHRDSPNGPRVKYTHVGEQLYHVWECPSKMYSMLLYNCQAIDGKGSEYSIVDGNGCSKDEFLMPQITYTQDRTKAMAASAAFNFPDRNTMSFTCKIKLCMNTDLECINVTPPNCNGKRAKSASNGNFNEDTSGESASNSTEPSTSTVASVISSTWATLWGSGISTEGRKVVSGEVIADVEGDSSTEAGTTGSSPSTSTINSTPSTTQSTSTISSTTAGSSTTPKLASTTTEEQLLSSQERMSSASAEHPPASSHGQQPSPQPSSWATSALEEQKPTLATSSELPSDFPRPDLLLQKDQALLVPPVKRGVGARMEKLEKLDESVDRADPSWTITAEEEAKESKRRQEAEPVEFNWSTKPVQIFDKRGEGAKSARSQRDTTRGPPHEKAAVIRRKAGGQGMVDFDISSPELMIMDDYEPAASAQKGGITANNQRSSVQEAPFIDWTSDKRGSAVGNGVCLSPIALICAGILLAMLILVVVFVLIRASRKSSGTAMEHSFYSS